MIKTLKDMIREIEAIKEQHPNATFIAFEFGDFILQVEPEIKICYRDAGKKDFKNCD